MRTFRHSFGAVIGTLLLVLSLVFVIPNSEGMTKQTPVIMVVGDSLSLNYGVSRGWVDLLQNRLDEKVIQYQVYNASRVSNTVGRTSRKLSDLSELILLWKPTIVILELGAVDGFMHIPPNEINNNMSAIIHSLQERSVKVLLVGMRLPPHYEHTYRIQFENIYKDLSKRFKVPLVPFLLSGIVTEPGYMQSDGLHPTEKAQGKVLENVWEYLNPML